MRSRHHACLLCCVHSMRLARVLLSFVLAVDGVSFATVVLRSRLRPRTSSGGDTAPHLRPNSLDPFSSSHSGQERMKFITRLINDLYAEFLEPREQCALADSSGCGQLLAQDDYQSLARPIPRASEHPVAGYLAGAAIPVPRHEAWPLPSAVLVQWERWICSGSGQNTESISLVRFGSWYGQASALQLRSANVLVVASRQTRPAGRVLANRSFQIWPAIWCSCGLEKCVLQHASLKTW